MTEIAKNALFSKYKKTAKERGLQWLLSKDTFDVLINQECFYCGVSPKQKYKTNSRSKNVYFYNGIDRVDNTQGYTAENCVTCCKVCNWAKNAFSIEDFLDWVYRISNHQRLLCINE
jgi:hypothetical protein